MHSLALFFVLCQQVKNFRRDGFIIHKALIKNGLVTLLLLAVQNWLLLSQAHEAALVSSFGNSFCPFNVISGLIAHVSTLGSDSKLFDNVVQFFNSLKQSLALLLPINQLLPHNLGLLSGLLSRYR